MSLEHDLEIAVNHLYSVFARYDRLSKFVGCACGTCVSEEDNRAIHAKPLRQLSEDDIKPIANSAAFEVTDLKHLLPRACELLAFGGADWLRWEPVMWFDKLLWDLDVDWRRWPESEQAAVERYFLALWRERLASPPTREPIEEILVVIAQVFDHLQSFLDIWESELSAYSLQHLLHFAEHEMEDIAIMGGLRNPFWEKRGWQMEEVLAWLTSPELGLRLAKRAHVPYDQALPDYIDELSRVQVALGRLRRARQDVVYFAELWWGSGSIGALSDLARRVEENRDALRTGGPIRLLFGPASRQNPWARRPEQLEALHRWILRPDTITMLEDAGRQYEARNLLEAAEQLRRIRQERESPEA